MLCTRSDRETVKFYQNVCGAMKVFYINYQFKYQYLPVFFLHHNFSLIKCLPSTSAININNLIASISPGVFLANKFNQLYIPIEFIKIYDLKSLSDSMVEKVEKYLSYILTRRSEARTKSHFLI